MPRLPDIRDVRRTSSVGLRLPALDGPQVDPTGNALEGLGVAVGEFGAALGELSRRRKQTEEARDTATLLQLDNDFCQGAREFARAPSEDQTDFPTDGGAAPRDPVAAGTRLYNLFLAEKLKPFRGTALEGRARALADTHRNSFAVRLDIDAVETGKARAGAAFRRLIGEELAGAESDPAGIVHAGRRIGLRLEQLAGLEGWSPERLANETKAQDRELMVRALRARLARGEAGPVRDILDDPDAVAELGQETVTMLRHEAAAGEESNRIALRNDAAAALERVEATGETDPALAGRAKAVLPADEYAGYEAGVRLARAVHGFGRAHHAASFAEIDAALADADPGADAGAEARATYEALQGKARRMIAARLADPAADAQSDPNVAAALAAGDRSRAAALSLAVQERRGVPVERQRVLTREEAQTEAANLDALPHAARAPRLRELEEAFGQHYPRLLGDLAAAGLDPETRAIAAVAGDPKALQTLLPALEQPYARLIEEIAPGELTAVNAELDAQLAVLAGQGSVSPAMPRFVFEKAALQAFRQTGDAASAVSGAIKTAGMSAEDDTLAGGARDDRLNETAALETGAKTNEFPESTPGETNADLSAPAEPSPDLRKRERDDVFSRAATAVTSKDSTLEDLYKSRNAVVKTLPQDRDDFILALQGVASGAHKKAELAPDIIQDKFKQCLKDNPEAKANERPEGFSTLGYFRGPDNKVYEATENLTEDPDFATLLDHLQTRILFKEMSSENKKIRARAIQRALKDPAVYALESGVFIRRVKVPGNSTFMVESVDINLHEKPISLTEYEKLPKIGEIDPHRIEPIYLEEIDSYVKNHSLRDIREKIDSGEEISPVPIAILDGKVVAFDPATILVFRWLGLDAKYRKATANEINEAIQKRQELLKIREKKGKPKSTKQ